MPLYTYLYASGIVIFCKLNKLLNKMSHNNIDVQVVKYSNNKYIIIHAY